MKTITVITQEGMYEKEVNPVPPPAPTATERWGTKRPVGFAPAKETS